MILIGILKHFPPSPILQFTASAADSLFLYYTPNHKTLFFFGGSSLTVKFKISHYAAKVDKILLF